MLKLVSLADSSEVADANEVVSIGIDLGRSKWAFAVSWEGQVHRDTIYRGHLQLPLTL